MNNENLKGLHGTLIKEGYNPPEYDQFAKDMEDEANLHGVYETLKREGYTPPSYDDFKNDMGFGTPVATDGGYTFTESQLEAMEKGAKPVAKDEQKPVAPPAYGTKEWGETKVEDDVDPDNPYRGMTRQEAVNAIGSKYMNEWYGQPGAYDKVKAELAAYNIASPGEYGHVTAAIRNHYVDSVARSRVEQLLQGFENVNGLSLGDVQAVMDSRAAREAIEEDLKRLGIRDTEGMYDDDDTKARERARKEYQQERDAYYQVLTKQMEQLLVDKYGYLPRTDGRSHAGMFAGSIVPQSAADHEERIRQREAVDLVGAYATPEIQEEFDKAMQRADEQFRAETEDSMMAPYGTGGQMLGAALRHWQAMDPAGIWEQMKLGIEQMAQKIAGSSAFFTDATALADDEGIETVQWIEKRVLPVLESQIQARFEQMAMEREMPKNTLEYLLANARESLVGTLFNAALASQSRRRMQSAALQRTEAGLEGYKPGFGARIAGGTAAMLPAMLLPYGGPFGLTAKVATKPVQGMTQALIADGMRPLMARMIQSSASGALLLGAFEGLKGGVEGALNPEGYSSYLEEDNRSAGEILSDIVKGSIERGVPSAVGGAAMIGGPVGQKISNGRGVLANLLGWGTQVGIDAAGATTLNMMPRIVEGDVTLEDVGKDFAGNVGTFAALGLHGKGREFAELANGGRSWNGVVFTKKDIKTLEDYYLEPLRTQIQEIESAQKCGGLVEESLLGVDAKEEQREAVNSYGAEMYNALMRSYAVPRELKVKVAQALAMPIPEHALKPEVIELEKEATAKSIELGWVDAMNYDYNKPGGVADKLRRGEELDGSELTLRLIFQDDKAFNDALKKQESSEPLTDAEQELVDANQERLRQIYREYSKEEHGRLASLFEQERGLEPGTVARMMKDAAEGKTVESNLLNEYESMLRDYLRSLDDARAAKEAEEAKVEQAVEEAVPEAVQETVNNDGENIQGGQVDNADGESAGVGASGAKVSDAADDPSATAPVSRIPVDDKGDPVWEKAAVEDTVAALRERLGSDDEVAATVGEEIADLESQLKEFAKADKGNGRKHSNMNERLKRKEAVRAAQGKLDYWNQVKEMISKPVEEAESVPKTPERIPELTESVPELTESVPELTESVQETPESVPAAEQPAEPQPPVQPQPPTAEQRIAQGTVRNNIGRRFGFMNQDGTRSEVVVDGFNGDGKVDVTRQDYDAGGSVKGEPYKQSLDMVDVGKSIVKGLMKPVLSTEEKLRKVHKFDKFKYGNVTILDVLTDEEQRQVLDAYERGDKEAVGNLVGDFMNSHSEDMILKGRDNRNQAVSHIMDGTGSREEKLRRVRKEYERMGDASLMLGDEAMQPATLEEYVADLHSRVPKSGEGVLAWFSYDRDGSKVVGMQDETGFGAKGGGDAAGFKPWLAPKGKGMSLQEYAERLHGQLPEKIQEQYSDQDVRNAVIELFTGAERPGDITTTILRSRVEQAEQAARHIEERWLDGGPDYQKVSADDSSFAGRLSRAKEQTNTEPTEKQKEAGNYRKGHVSFGGYDFVVENPEGSMRRGRDADGKPWEQQMHNTYGYILGKRGKDGDHLDMFINDNADLDTWNGKVYVVDQVNPDGNFDEHKIVYGYDSEAEARDAYLSNYAEGWQGLGRITGVDKDTFDRWLDSSDRKIKPFAEHSIIKNAVKPVEAEPQSSVTTPAERDKALMDAVVDKMKEAGIDVSTDWEEGQKVLDEFNGSQELKPMGQKTNKKKAQVASDLEGKELTSEQQAVVDVYTGKKNNAIVEFTRDGKKNRIAMRKGNERFAGTEHSLYGHFGTSEGVISSEDILRIPDILSNGEKTPVKVKNKQRYEYTLEADDGTEFTVVTERNNHGREEFTDFYSNKKGDISRSSTPSEEARASDADNALRKASTPASFNTPEGARSTRDDALSGAKVQQNPETGKESEKKLFKTPDGHAYGFTYRGKIYIDPRIATAETPIHEYGHLWAEMKRKSAPEEWGRIKDVLLGDKMVKPIIDRVRRDYPELAREGREDDFVEEVLTQFSGRHGAERLRSMAEEIRGELGGDATAETIAEAAIRRVKGVLNAFWKGVCDMMGWKYTSAEDVADAVLRDLLNGVDPRAEMRESHAFDDIKPVGTGDFGDIYDQFKGRPKEAVEFLMKKKGGVAKSALHHDGVGDIDIVWGDRTRGLEHIQAKHPDIAENLQEILDDMEIRRSSDNRIVLDSDTHKAVVSRDWYGKKTDNWLLTAYEKKEKGNSGGSIDIDPEPGGKQNGTAPLQESPSSGGKDTKKSDTLQGNEGENSSEGPKFQKAGGESSPEPELTPEERHYWKKWESDLAKWKERNGFAADAEEPGEETPMQEGEDMTDYILRTARHRIDKAKWQTAPRLDDYLQVRSDRDTVEAARRNLERFPESQAAKMRLAAAEFRQIRSAMRRQKAYDKATVQAVTDFAQDFMKMGFGDSLTRGEVERLLSSVKNATGARDIRKATDNIMNILTDSYLRSLDQQVRKLSSVKELRQTAQGVEAQGKLELKGQKMIQEFRRARQDRMTADEIRAEMGQLMERMTLNGEEAPMLEQEYEGLSIALQYQEDIEASRSEWGALDREYREALRGYKESGRTYAAQQQLLESLDQAMMENKIERIGMFGDIIGRLQGNISESMQGAREFVERERERVKKIQQMANFDLAGKDYGAMREKVKGKPANFFLQPLATFEQMLRLFGSRNASGEGYLYNHFMRNWMDATDKAYLGEKAAKEELDAKAREIFGDETRNRFLKKATGGLVDLKVKRWSDLYDITRRLPTMELEVLDGEEKKTFTLTQGNLLYIYMADKMTDGRMKLRKMGIDEAAVAKVKEFLDPRLVELGDWLQDEYLVKKRTEYNKVHERMFGAPMASIDHYFPLKILGDARYQEQDVSNMADQDAVLPSTITGNIIKRRKNALPLDILHTDALSLAIEHVEDMERWAATAEWNRDINTLLSYTTFRNKVKNMKTIYGSGDALWNTFADTARMAAGTYRPKTKPGSADAAISNVAKGVTAAKISFRLYTAMKQWLSLPAFFHDVRIDDLLKNMVNSYGTVKWAYENMPVYQKRWKSRQVGDTRLMDDPTDWKIWKKGWVDGLARVGMLPNAAVDALTIAWGARSIYDSRYRKYKGMGASDEDAHKRALQDAEIGYNLTQQSSEGAFVSAIQKDRTVAANMLSVFRNSSMSYTRQWVDAARNLRHRMQKGYKEDSIKFMARQMQEEFGLDEAQAQEAAEAEYARAGRRDVARMLNMMFGVTVAWNLGASLPYLLIGDDWETKKEMLTDALLRGLVAGPTEGLAAGNIWSEMIADGLSEKTRNAIKNEGWGAGLDAAWNQVGDYEINPLPFLADLQGMIKKMGYDRFAAAQDVFNICMQSAVGVNPQTFTDMWNACMDWGAPGWDGTEYSSDAENLARPKEIALFIMRVMNAPTSSWRNKYIDELGMGAEDAQKLPYEEMARRYAHYKHWKDAPIMGWLRGEEGREAKMEKIRGQFDDAVRERMGRLTDEGLEKTYEGSADDVGARRMVVKEAAKRAGSDDALGSTTSRDGGKRLGADSYLRRRTWQDLEEDLAVVKAQRECQAVKKRLSELESAHYGARSAEDVERLRKEAAEYRRDSKAVLALLKDIEKAVGRMKKERDGLTGFDDMDAGRWDRIREIRGKILRKIQDEAGNGLNVE